MQISFNVYIVIAITVVLIYLFKIAFKPTFTGNCPSCNSNSEVERVKRGFVGKYVLFFLKLKKMRCNKCYTNFNHLLAPPTKGQAIYK
ncbi:MAG: hypothetical protein CFE21_12690 [Bacteroidetes bacterium B1(2017)]|nr:MAG: hypothetical protein CFE21_12690 [Bacteroidetes bacterium B1(2017)]